MTWSSRAIGTPSVCGLSERRQELVITVIQQRRVGALARRQITLQQHLVSVITPRKPEVMDCKATQIPVGDRHTYDHYRFATVSRQRIVALRDG